ncbi:MAG: glycosyltransferase family 2 protein [Firmicutes bacterium]|nr:glycosyltransferase family 2 protein [Bacillota bacterium]
MNTSEKLGNRLFIVVPCYKEQEVLPETAKRLKEKMGTLIGSGKIAGDSHVLFVNDGSSDNTWEIISKLHEEDPLFWGISLSRNRGHQNALLAGLMTAKDYADMTVSMDADLQDDMDAVDAMVDKYLEGYDIVYGVRSSRATDSFFKRFTAEAYYKVIKKLGADIVYNHADFRLMSRRALEGLAEFKEVNLFLRGIVPQIGYPSAIVTYERHERFAGESKYPLSKMLSLAFEGITSFSVKPIRFVYRTGAVIAFVAVIFLLYCLIVKLTGHSVSGWSSLMGSIWLLGGIQLFCIGIIGEYIGKIYMESKQRPRYIIQEYLVDAPEEPSGGTECSTK